MRIVFVTPVISRQKVTITIKMKMYSRKCCSPLAFLMYAFILYVNISCFSLLILSSCNNARDFKQIVSFANKSLYNHWPLCSNDMLDKRNFYYEKWARGAYNSDVLISRTDPRFSCRLLRYTAERVVACFDGLHKKRLRQTYSSMGNKIKKFQQLHFVFIGDSRIRQQFFYFLKLVPDYDRITQPVEIPKNVYSFHHGDVEVESRILGLRVSFKWQPVMNHTVMETIRQWKYATKVETPDLVFLSIEIYHMLQENGADFPLYYNQLDHLGSILNDISTRSKIVWLNQYPTVDFYGNINSRNTDIYTMKIYHYNSAVRRILENYRSIFIWDSSDSLVEEYVRGCLIFSEREHPNPFFVKPQNRFINCKPYRNCLDFVHVGYVAVSQATQLLYNDICNKKV